MPQKGKKNKVANVYNTKHKKALELYRDGMSIRNIAKALKMSCRTFYEWQEKYAEFKAAVEEANKIRVDNIVSSSEEAMLMRIEGIEYLEEYLEYDHRILDENGNPKIIKQTITKKWLPPSDRCIEMAMRFMHPKFRDEPGDHNQIVTLKFEEVNDNGNSGARDKLPT